MTRLRPALNALTRIVGPDGTGRWAGSGPRLRWTIRELMLIVLLIGVALGVLRVRWGLIFALMAGGVVGCGLAPWHAVHAMRKLDAELTARPDLRPRDRALLVAQSYVFVWAAWYFAGILVALAGIAAWWLLRNS